MHSSNELGHIRNQISSELRKSPLMMVSDKLPLVHSRSISQHGNLNEVLSRDISHRHDTSQKPKTSFENMEMQLRAILGIKQESCKLPTDFEELENFLKKNLEVTEKERLVQELERMKVNVGDQKEKFLGKVVKEGGLLYRTQSGLLQPQMCRLYDQIKSKGKQGKKGRIEGGEIKKGDMELGMPSGRKEVEILIAWLENMSSVYLEEDGISSDEKVRRAQVIYTACFKEVVRQVSVQCIERGILIQRIWNASVDLSSLKEDMRVQQMQELQRKVQNITDTTISDLKSRCGKAEKYISDLKGIIEEKDEELLLFKQQEHPATPEFKVQYVPFDRSSQKPKFKRNSTKLAKKNSIKSSIEDSVQEINELSVIANQPVILFGYVDETGVFHKQKIIHKNEEGVHLNHYFDEVIEIAKANSIGTSPRNFEVKNEEIEEVKDKIEIFYVKVEQKFTQFPEFKMPLQISKQFNSRVLIKPTKSSPKDLLEIKKPKTKRLKSVEMDPQGVSEEEFSESCSEFEERKNEKVVKTKGKGKIGMKKNIKFRTMRKKNEIKINVNERNEKKIEEIYLEENEEQRPKSKSQLTEGMRSSEGFNRKGRLSEFYQGNSKKPNDPIKTSDQAEGLGKGLKPNKNVGITSRSNLRTQKLTKRKKGGESSESENSGEKNAYKASDPDLIPGKKSKSPEKNIPKYGKSSVKTEKSPLKSETKPEKSQLKSKLNTENLKTAGKKAIKINTTDKPDHYFTYQQEEISKLLENPKKISQVASSVKLLEEPLSPDKLPAKIQKTDPDIKRNQKKTQSPLKATITTSNPVQPQEKSSKKLNPSKPDQVFEPSPTITKDKSCQVQLDPIPSEDLTRAQVLSSIQQLKNTLEGYKQDNSKQNKLINDTRAFKRASKLSNILKNLFNIPEQHPNTIIKKIQLGNPTDEPKNVNSGESNFKENSFEVSDNEGNGKRAKKRENNTGNKAFQRSITLFEEFSLGIVSRKIIVSHPGQKMLSLVLQSIDSFASIRPEMSAKSLIKMINAVYSEKISILKEQGGFKASDVSMILYEFVINMYGLKTVAENKFKQIIISTLAYRDQYPRINNFSKFLNLNSSYNPEDWNFYLSLFETLDYHNFGLNLSNEVNHYSSLQTVNFCIRQHLESKIKNEDIEEIVSASCALLETQPESSINKKKSLKSDLVNTDKLLELLLKYYYKFKGKIYERLEISVPREDFYNLKQFSEVLQKVGKKEGAEKIFEAHCLNRKDELGELSKVIRVETVLSVLFDHGLIEL